MTYLSEMETCEGCGDVFPGILSGSNKYCWKCSIRNRKTEREHKEKKVTHPTHKIRVSDATTFDETCTLCGATDASVITASMESALDKPCPKAETTVASSGIKASTIEEINKFYGQYKDAKSTLEHLVSLKDYDRASFAIVIGTTYPNDARQMKAKISGEVVAKMLRISVDEAAQKLRDLGVDPEA